MAGTLLAWGAIALAAFVALWPAMWVDPVGTLADVTTAALGYAQAGHDEALYFQGQVLADGKMDASFFQFYPITFLWRTTPVILIGLLAAAVAFLRKRTPLGRGRSRFAVVGLLLTAAILAIELNLAAKKFDRYLLPVYPLLDLVAATGWIALSSWLGSLLPARAGRVALPLVVGAALTLQAVGSLQTYPYYLSYYNPLLGGSRKAPETMMIGWGEGLDEAARYLNAKADAGHLVVAACYRPAFAPFFDGISPSIPTEEDLSEAQTQRALAADYVLSYANHWQRQMCRPLCQYLAKWEPEHSIWINGLEYVRIYRLHRGATAR